MKVRSYKLLFNIFSYLADKTNGASLFVKYKLILGTLIIGLAACGKQKPAQTNCYQLATPPEPDTTLVTCYDVDTSVLEKDTAKRKLPPFVEPVIISDIDISEEPVVMCYMVQADPIEVIPIDSLMDYSAVHQPPVSPVGDLEKFSKWVQDNVEYPQIMLENKIEGRLVASFIIDEDGNVTEPTIVQKITPDADNGVLRAITSSGKWTPGWHHGKKVKTSVIIPVKFTLPEE